MGRQRNEYALTGGGIFIIDEDNTAGAALGVAIAFTTDAQLAIDADSTTTLIVVAAVAGCIRISHQQSSFKHKPRNIKYCEFSNINNI
jgi:hypothetical protein